MTTQNIESSQKITTIEREFNKEKLNRKGIGYKTDSSGRVVEVVNLKSGKRTTATTVIIEKDGERTRYNYPAKLNKTETVIQADERGFISAPASEVRKNARIFKDRETGEVKVFTTPEKQKSEIGGELRLPRETTKEYRSVKRNEYVIPVSSGVVEKYFTPEVQTAYTEIRQRQVAIKSLGLTESEAERLNIEETIQSRQKKLFGAETVTSKTPETNLLKTQYGLVKAGVFSTFQESKAFTTSKGGAVVLSAWSTGVRWTSDFAGTVGEIPLGIGNFREMHKQEYIWLMSKTNLKPETKQKLLQIYSYAEKPEKIGYLATPKTSKGIRLAETKGAEYGALTIDLVLIGGAVGYGVYKVGSTARAVGIKNLVTKPIQSFKVKKTPTLISVDDSRTLITSYDDSAKLSTKIKNRFLPKYEKSFSSSRALSETSSRVTFEVLQRGTLQRVQVTGLITQRGIISLNSGSGKMIITSKAIVPRVLKSGKIKGSKVYTQTSKFLLSGQFETAQVVTPEGRITTLFNTKGNFQTKPSSYGIRETFKVKGYKPIKQYSGIEQSLGSRINVFDIKKGYVGTFETGRLATTQTQLRTPVSRLSTPYAEIRSELIFSKGRSVLVSRRVRPARAMVETPDELMTGFSIGDYLPAGDIKTATISFKSQNLIVIRDETVSTGVKIRQLTTDRNIFGIGLPSPFKPKPQTIIQAPELKSFKVPQSLKPIKTGTSAFGVLAESPNIALPFKSRINLFPISSLGLKGITSVRAEKLPLLKINTATKINIKIKETALQLQQVKSKTLLIQSQKLKIPTLSNKKVLAPAVPNVIIPNLTNPAVPVGAIPFMFKLGNSEGSKSRRPRSKFNYLKFNLINIGFGLK